MARTSQAKGGEAARGQQPRASVKRAAARGKANQVAAAVTRVELPPPAEAEPVATAQPDVVAAAAARPKSPPTPEAAAPTGGEAAGSPPAEPEPVVDDPEPAAEIAADEARVAATVVESQPVLETPVLETPVPATPVPETQPLGTAGHVPDPAAMLGAGHSLVEGTLRAHGQMIGFTCRQAEHGLAVGRAMLTSGSLPAALALQAEYVGRAFDDALAQTLELSRLSTDLMRASLRSLGRR